MELELVLIKLQVTYLIAVLQARVTGGIYLD